MYPRPGSLDRVVMPSLTSSDHRAVEVGVAFSFVCPGHSPLDRFRRGENGLGRNNQTSPLLFKGSLGSVMARVSLRSSSAMRENYNASQPPHSSGSAPLSCAAAFYREASNRTLCFYLDHAQAVSCWTLTLPSFSQSHVSALHPLVSRVGFQNERTGQSGTGRRREDKADHLFSSSSTFSRFEHDMDIFRLEWPGGLLAGTHVVSIELQPLQQTTRKERELTGNEDIRVTPAPHYSSPSPSFASSLLPMPFTRSTRDSIDRTAVFSIREEGGKRGENGETKRDDVILGIRTDHAFFTGETLSSSSSASEPPSYASTSSLPSSGWTPSQPPSFPFSFPLPSSSASSMSATSVFLTPRDTEEVLRLLPTSEPLTRSYSPSGSPSDADMRESGNGENGNSDNGAISVMLKVRIPLSEEQRRREDRGGEREAIKERKGERKEKAKNRIEQRKNESAGGIETRGQGSRRERRFCLWLTHNGSRGPRRLSCTSPPSLHPSLYSFPPRLSPSFSLSLSFPSLSPLPTPGSATEHWKGLVFSVDPRDVGSGLHALSLVEEERESEAEGICNGNIVSSKHGTRHHEENQSKEEKEEGCEGRMGRAKRTYSRRGTILLNAVAWDAVPRVEILSPVSESEVQRENVWISLGVSHFQMGRVCLSIDEGELSACVESVDEPLHLRGLR